MINVICLYNHDQLKSIEITGHAETNIKGHDLVCAAVSAISIGAVNALEGFKEKEVVCEEGNLKVNIDHKLSKEDYIRLMMMITQLEILANGYKKIIKIKKENKL